jgi:sugar phosphate isomerase/epimerase
MELGIFAKTFSGSTPMEVLTAARRAGYTSVQYNMACSGIGPLPVEVSEEVADAVAMASRETGVSIVAISATYNMIHPVRAIRETGRRSFEAIASRAARMGAGLLTVCSGSCDPEDQWRHHPDNNTETAWLEMIREFRLLDEVARRYDIRIGVEPELANVVSSAHKARALIDALASDRIRIVFDPANLFEREDSRARKETIENAIHLLKDRIEITHAKDRNADGSFATAGKGVIDYVHYISVLRRSGFDGALVAHGLSHDEAEGVFQFLRSIMESS